MNIHQQYIYQPEATALFKTLQANESISEADQYALAGYILTELSKVYKELGWVIQFHLGPTRNNNTSMYQQVGRQWI